ncbi:hypothetical protein BH09PLA1_BH09PLA1_05440 [soil metagenome]
MPTKSLLWGIVGAAREIRTFIRGQNVFDDRDMFTNSTCRNRQRAAKSRRGIALTYAVVALPVMAGLCSLGVDYGYSQLIKTELRRTADATAHDYMVLYGMNGKSYANANGPQSYAQNTNPVASFSGQPPTVKVKWGYFDSATNSFTTGNNGGDVAVQVTVSYTKAKGNAVPLMFGSVLGAQSVDISATAIATYSPPQSVNMSVLATSDPYLAGMPANTTSTYGDNATNNGATQVSGISVSPGDIITFTNFTGTSSVLPGYMPYVGPAGVANNPYGTATHHGMSWDGSGSAYTENGIADAIMPESSLMALFLDANAPNTTPAPSTVVDWTNSSLKDQAVYSSLQAKAPFYIGTGMTSTGTVKQFVVPAGATRMFIGSWDGLQFNNNGGSFSGTITRKSSVQLVR